MQLRNDKGQTLNEFLIAYDENKYRRPSVTVDMAVFTLVKAPEGGHEIAVLLVRRKDHPFIGAWALPGGFLNMEEELHEAAARELREETGVTGVPLVQFGTFGGVHRDPRTRVITVGHFALAPYGSLTIQAGDDAADAALFRVSLRREGYTKDAVLFRMRFNGPHELRARARLAFNSLGPRPALVPGGDLASDHSLVLFSALTALSGVKRESAARLLAGDTLGIAAPAYEALQALFCDLDEQPG